MQQMSITTSSDEFLQYFSGERCVDAKYERGISSLVTVKYGKVSALLRLMALVKMHHLSLYGELKEDNRDTEISSEQVSGGGCGGVCGVCVCVCG